MELIGTLKSINTAEKLIKEVMAEADAGGSPALVARGFTLAAGVMEQIQIQVPNEKVGLIIGKGGETIKNIQTRSCARIQLLPQHLAEGDKSKERTLRVSGDKKQIDIARELIKEAMNQFVERMVAMEKMMSQLLAAAGTSSQPSVTSAAAPSTLDTQQPSQHSSDPQQASALDTQLSQEPSDTQDASASQPSSAQQ